MPKLYTVLSPPDLFCDSAFYEEDGQPHFFCCFFISVMWGWGSRVCVSLLYYKTQGLTTCFTCDLRCLLQAKLKASVSWILTKAYGSSIPSQLKDPFYENAKVSKEKMPR